MLPHFVQELELSRRLGWALGLTLLLAACHASFPEPVDPPGQTMSAARAGDPCDPATFQQVCGSASTVLFCPSTTKTVTEVACTGTEPVCTSVVVENGTNYPPTRSGCVPFVCPHAPFCQDEYNLWYCREDQLHLAHSARGGECVGTTSISCFTDASGVHLQMRDEAASFGKFCGTYACAVGTCHNVAETPECDTVCLDRTTVGKRCEGFLTRPLQDCAAQGMVCGQAWPEYNRTQCWPPCNETTSPTCDGNVLRICTSNVAGSQTGRVLVSRDCANEGMVCGVNPSTAQKDCITGNPGTSSMREVEFNSMLHPYYANKIWKSGLLVTGTIAYGAPSTPTVPSLVASDVDYYYIPVPPSSTLTVDLSVPAGADFDVMLRYSSGVPLTGSLNGGAGLAERVTYVNSTSVAMDIYIQVFGKEGSWSSLPYTLLATISSFTGGCAPTQCNVQASNCGTRPDGCGGELVCGPTCLYPSTCGGGGVENRCGSACTTFQSCDVQGKNCGILSDGCGGTLDCGTCPEGQLCGAGGTPNVCGCTPTTCAAQGKDCGTLSDGCGGTLSCGTCTAPQTCGGGGTPNVCGAPTLTLTATGRSGESVFSEPSGLRVPVGQTGSANFAAGTQLTLRATNNRDVVWSGVCSSGGAKTKSCTFTLNNNASETANVQ